MTVCCANSTNDLLSFVISLKVSLMASLMVVFLCWEWRSESIKVSEMSGREDTCPINDIMLMSLVKTLLLCLIGQLSLVRFWCLSSNRPQTNGNNAMMSQLLIPLNRCDRPHQLVHSKFVTSQHCLSSFWRQTNIRVS